VARLSQMLEGPASQADVARQRVERFLAQQRGAAGAPPMVAKPHSRRKPTPKVSPRGKTKAKRRPR